MTDNEKTFASLIEKTMSEGTPQQKQHLKNQVIKLLSHLQSIDAAHAAEVLSSLESINWQNYLSQKEATAIISGLQNPSPWHEYPKWKDKMDDADYEYSEPGIYNCYALFAMMNIVFDTHLQTICMISGKKLSDIPDDDMFGHVYLLAVDYLKDGCKRFDIRSQYRLDVVE